MSEKSRRRFLRTSGVVAGAITVPGAVTAETDRAEKGIDVNDKTTLSEAGESDFGLTTQSDDVKIVGVSITEDGERFNFVFAIDPTDGSASYTKVTDRRYRTLVSSEHSTPDSVQGPPIGTFDDIIQRSTEYAYNLGDCIKHDGYEHLYAAVSVEFHDDINNYSWLAIAGALAATVSNPVLVAAISLAGGIGAIESDTDTITFAGQDYDVSKWGFTVSGYKAMVNAGWKRDRDDLITISHGPSHPAMY